jgi:hypothetical protein
MEIETETDCELNVITSVNLITKMSTHQIYIKLSSHSDLVGKVPRSPWGVKQTFNESINQ